MADLAHVLRHVPKTSPEQLLSGSDFADDAAVYRLSDDLALVQTVDFLTPIVDDPYTFGRIAAANALSDVYAVGGRPLTALNIVCFPIQMLDREVLAEILRGGADKVAEAGAAIVGGHTVDDSEPKYGLAVTGTVQPDRFVSAHGAQPGDTLVLTKPIGTGVIGTAIKGGHASQTDTRQAVRWMELLNRQAASAMLTAGAHACTDVTGFGLLGHLAEMARASGVSAEINVGAVPVLPGAVQHARNGHVPAGTHNNLGAVGKVVRFAEGTDDLDRLLLADPQTSGGLLVSISPDRVEAFRASMAEAGLAAVIGRIISGEPGRIFVKP